MLIVTREQIDALATAALRNFEFEMVEHLRVFVPGAAESAGVERVRAAVRLGIERAAGYGITQRGPVRSYLEMCAALGCGFDTDPLHPWAADILSGPDRASPMARAHRLFERFVDHLERVNGPDNNLALAALRRLGALARNPRPPSVDGSPDAMLTVLQALHPEKAAACGTPALLALIGQGAALAAERGYPAPRGAAVCTLLMFVLGHRFPEDPLLPWFALPAEEGAPANRLQQLERRAIVYLEAALIRQEAV